MSSSVPAVVILALTLSATPADATDDPPGALLIPSANALSGPHPIVSQNVTWGDAKVSRPPALVALYASYAALQVYDVYSTTRAVAHGAREANPFMQSVVGNVPAFVAVKAAAGIATIAATERLWKRHKGAAIAAMLAANSVSAIVAARNAHTLRRITSGDAALR